MIHESELLTLNFLTNKRELCGYELIQAVAVESESEKKINDNASPDEKMIQWGPVRSFNRDLGNITKSNTQYLTLYF